MIGEKIFIFEFISGGGFNKVDIPNSLFCEGFGMLRVIIKDFKLLGFETSTLLDYRIHHLSTFLSIDKSFKVEKHENFINPFEILVKDSDYCFIIAPDSGNILFNLTSIVKEYRKILLSTNLEGIEIGASKINTYHFFQKYKLLTPKTYLIPYKNKNLDLEFIIRKFNELNGPIIIKPEDGVGAESIHFFERINQIKDFFHKYNSKIITSRSYILQEYIKGKDLSISLINAPSETSQIPSILSINSQDVKIKNLNKESEYLGGYTPINDYQEASLELKKILKDVDFSLFSGYFGIDIIRNKDSNFYFIEINPRLTTSYIGIRNLISQNPAKLILDSKLSQAKPKEVRIQNFSLFTKINLMYLKSKLNKQLKELLIKESIKRIPELVTPPISLNETNQFTCFIATKTKDLSSSKKRMKQIQQILKELNFVIIK